MTLLKPHFWVPLLSCHPSRGPLTCSPFPLVFQNTETLIPGPTVQATLMPLTSTSCFPLSGAASLWPSPGAWPLTGQATLLSPQAGLRHPSLATSVSPTIKRQTDLLFLPELWSLSLECDLLGVRDSATWFIRNPHRAWHSADLPGFCQGSYL